MLNAILPNMCKEVGIDCISRNVTEVRGSGSTVSESLEIVNSARGMLNSGRLLNCTVNVNVNSKQ